jgi:hypothetical protein
MPLKHQLILGKTAVERVSDTIRREPNFFEAHFEEGMRSDWRAQEMRQQLAAEAYAQVSDVPIDGLLDQGLLVDEVRIAFEVGDVLEAA